MATLLGACGGDSPSEPTNADPQANAGSNQVLATGSVVTLDASASSDADGDALTYSWSLTSPSGSAATLSSTSAQMPTFTADVAGTYAADLSVSDGTASASASVLVAALVSYCDGLVDLFPTPVNGSSSPFANTDDAFISVPFGAGFQFPFYGELYDDIYLNTNGGLTLGEGVPAFDVAAGLLNVPTIAPFWGDMAAQAVPERPAQMVYEACPDRFTIHYGDLQDFDVAAWDNSATVTLSTDGTITIEYGEVASEDILVGIFDGEHTADAYVAVQDAYYDYDAASGTVLFDGNGPGPMHAGELTGRTVTFDPSPAPAPGPR